MLFTIYINVYLVHNTLVKQLELHKIVITDHRYCFITNHGHVLRFHKCYMTWNNFRKDKAYVNRLLYTSCHYCLPQRTSCWYCFTQCTSWHYCLPQCTSCQYCFTQCTSWHYCLPQCTSCQYCFTQCTSHNCFPQCTKYLYFLPQCTSHHCPPQCTSIVSNNMLLYNSQTNYYVTQYTTYYFGLYFHNAIYTRINPEHIYGLCRH